MSRIITLATDNLIVNLYDARCVNQAFAAMTDYIKACLHTINEGGWYNYGTCEFRMSDNDGDVVITHDDVELKLEHHHKSGAVWWRPYENEARKFWASFDPDNDNRHDQYVKEVLEHLFDILDQEGFII